MLKNTFFFKVIFNKTICIQKTGNDNTNLGTTCPRGPNVMGTICPWEPFVFGTKCLWDQINWDHLSLGTKCVWGSNEFGTKCVTTKKSPRKIWTKFEVFSCLFKQWEEKKICILKQHLGSMRNRILDSFIREIFAIHLRLM